MGVHLSAIARAHATGIFQIANADGTAVVLGLRDADVIIADTVAWSDLTSVAPACTFANIDKQACTTAAHRVCAGTMFNTTSGYGPVMFTNASSPVTLVCLP